MIRPSALQIHPKRTNKLVDRVKDAVGSAPILSEFISNSKGFGLSFWLIMVALMCSFIWAFWTPALPDLWNVWMRSDEYSSGLLVPIIALYILWLGRHDRSRWICCPAWIGGIGLFLTAQGLRMVFGLYFGMSSVENLTIVMTLWSIVLLVCGWKVVWRLKALLLFLLLMLPIPGQIQSAITLPLQRWSTNSAVFSLETLGYAVRQEGNIIDINGTFVAVAEACNGLRMITAFFVISGLVALVVRRFWWEKLILVASSVPIALLCNTIRLAVTAIAFTMIDGAYWEKAFHDFGGLAMMPLALFLVVAELWFLSHLIISAPKPERIVYRK